MGDQKVNVRHHGRGIRTAIVGNCDHFTRPAVEALGLEDEVDALILSFEVGAMMPDAPGHEEALGRLVVDAAQAVFVDDQPDFCDGAVALGIRTFRIDRDGPNLDPGADTNLKSSLRAAPRRFGSGASARKRPGVRPLAGPRTTPRGFAPPG